MKLKDITIENFRGIRFLNLPLDKLTVLIGENNTGKSTVLEAIRLVLTRGFGVRRDGGFTEYDFHMKDAAATPHTAEPISITLHFAEDEKDEWPASVVQQLFEVCQPDGGLNHIWLQAKGSYHLESGSFETKRVFLNHERSELPLKNTAPLNLISKIVPLFSFQHCAMPIGSLARAASFGADFSGPSNFLMSSVKKSRKRSRRLIHRLSALTPGWQR